MNEQLVAKGLLVSYSVNRAKEQGGKTLLFLHGWRSSKEIWQPIVTSLEIADCQRITLDLPGFGQSQVPKQPMTVGDYAEVVAEFIKKLDLKNFIIVGHSFGGRVGIKLASHHPELISKLVLVDSAGFVTPQTKKRVMELGAKLVKPFFLPKFMQGPRRKIYKLIGADDYVATPELQKTFVNVVGEDLSEDMEKISCPTFIVFGENDRETPSSFAEKMHALIPNSKFLILPKAGHFSFLDQSAKFINLLKDFIA